MKKKILMFAALVVVAALAASVAWIVKPEGTGAAGDDFADDLIPVDEVMKLAGYEARGGNAYGKTGSGVPDITVTFDPKAETCFRNQYSIDLEDQLVTSDNALYLSREKLRDVLNCDIDYKDGKYEVTPVAYAPHAWTEVSPLIAHAGGAVRHSTFSSIYTNSLEALVENYNLGHRVFEFDFCLTSDGDLALLHDWDSFGLRNGVPMSSEAWKALKAYGNPVTRGRYTTMLVGDVLDEMAVNGDMFMITDTKAENVTEEDILRQFTLLRDGAMARDPALIDRIVPQIYNNGMYDVIMSVYPWKSIIYTTYANQLPADEIISFAAGKDNIRVITASKKDDRFGAKEIESIHRQGMLFYTHTVDEYAEVLTQLSRGVDGLYTNLVWSEEFDFCADIVARDAKGRETDDPSDLYFMDLSDVASRFNKGLAYIGGLEDCVVFLSVKGEAMDALSETALAAMRQLGLKADLEGKSDYSYLAVIGNGDTVELCDTIELIQSGVLPDGTPYEVTSAGTDCGNRSSIVIGGKDYSPNGKGFNIAVYSLDWHAVIHQGCYNTHKRS